ncbi:glycosyltransferase family 4 protein [Blastococcus atacamensis]|uniref:glycosyltransferase family 4 protein n=1 Tax=Blastococcus atacamensis TaxID=2070508 RepID=UPI0018E40D90|nr:glycosyltransferase family 1 protein [Blastococcus atacamensis]
MKVYMPGRILERHVGGNTTYSQALAGGLRARGWTVSAMPFSTSASLTMVKESLFALGRRNDALLHYTADTGPLVTSRTPTVVTVHGIASRWISTARTPRQETVWRRRVARAICLSDAVITVSRSSADDVASVFGLRPDEVEVIHHGIDPTYRIATEEDASVGAVDGLVPRDFLLYLGNIEPRKNLDALLDAHARLRARDDNAPILVLAGKPAWNYDETLKKIEAAGPAVRWLGFVSPEEKLWLLRNCSLFLFPSLYEGFGFPVLEALACGSPVLCSSNGSLAEVAGPALRLSGTGVDDIEDGLIRALGDTAALRACGQAGPAWARAFTWDTSIDAHQAVYRRVLS